MTIFSAVVHGIIHIFRYSPLTKMPPRKTPQKKAAENGTNGKKAAPVVNTVRHFLISNSVPGYFDSSLVSHSRSWSYFGETLKQGCGAGAALFEPEPPRSGGSGSATLAVIM